MSKLIKKIKPEHKLAFLGVLIVVGTFLVFKFSPVSSRRRLIPIPKKPMPSPIVEPTEIPQREAFREKAPTVYYDNDCVSSQTGQSLSFSEALKIGMQGECGRQGDWAGSYSCNENTGTWWFDWDLEKPGCSPACVVDVGTREAVINWRCTGLLVPTEVVPALDIKLQPTGTPQPCGCGR